MFQSAATDANRSTSGLKIEWLIVGRLLFGTTLLILSTSWSLEPAAASAIQLPNRSFLLGVAALVVISLIYALGARFSPAHSRQVRWQLTLDVLLVTWLVWLTGDVRSPYAALYIVIIALAGLYLGARDALMSAVGCSLSYTFFTLAVILHLLPSHVVSPPGASLLSADHVQKLGLNNIAFFVVGLLAAKLGEQRSKSDDQLLAATNALANLRALHERIVESMRSGVVITDIEGRIYSMNMAAEEITGREARELKGQPAANLFRGIDRLIGVCLDNSSGDGAVTTFATRAESVCRRPDGVTLSLGYSIVPLIAESGAATGFVVTFQDLTQIRALEERSRRQDRLAAVGRVSAGIAHEIRNPLAAMRGSIQMLCEEMTEDQSSRELMDIVLRESDRLNRIITDFLLYARPRPCELSVADLREPLRETVTLLRNSPEKGERHKIVERLPAAPLLAEFDAAQMRQVFWNLSRNALQSMPSGGTLTIGLQSTAKGDVEITFADTGCGISPEQQEKLFEPFSSSKSAGLGLGLSIVYQIIKDHRGDIELRSEQDRGTVVHIKLPGSVSLRPPAGESEAERRLAPTYG